MVLYNFEANDGSAVTCMLVQGQLGKPQIIKYPGFGIDCSIRIFLSFGSYFLAMYGKTFEWENFCSWYVNYHSQENFCSCLTLCHRVLCETYAISYSTKIHGKIVSIECKIVKVFPLESFAICVRYHEAKIIVYYVEIA